MQKHLLLIGSIFLAAHIFADHLTDKYVNVDGNNIHYYTTGTGSPVILLTGYATTSNFWDNEFVSCLAQQHSVYLIDYKGINTESNITADSSVQQMSTQIIDTKNKLNLGIVDIVGWSMGGAVSIEIAHDYPKQVRTISLLAPLTPNAKSPQNTSSIPELDTQEEILNYVFGNNIYNYTRTQLDKYRNSLLDANKTLFPNKTIIDTQKIARSTWQSLPGTFTDFLKTTTPALFIIADHDNKLDAASINKDATRYPNHTIMNAKNSGHNVSMQHPQWSCSIINQFIAKNHT